MRSVPNILPSVKFPNFCQCFLFFLHFLFFLEKKGENLGKKCSIWTDLLLVLSDCFMRYSSTAELLEPVLQWQRTRFWGCVNVGTTTAMWLPAVRVRTVRVRTGTTTVRDPQTGTAYPCCWHIDVLCLYRSIRRFFLIHPFLIYKPVLNLAVFFLRAKWSQALIA